MSWIYKYTELHMSTYYYFSSWPQKRASWEILIFTATLKLDLSGFPMLCLWRQQPLLLSRCHRPPLSTTSFALRVSASNGTHSPPSSLPTRLPLPTQPPPPLRAGLQWSLQLATAFPPLSERRSRGAGLWIQVKEKQADQGQKKNNGWGGGRKVMHDPLCEHMPPIKYPRLNTSLIIIMFLHHCCYLFRLFPPF